MAKRTKTVLGKSVRGEEGQAFILVLILLLVGSLIIAPLLAYMGTGVVTGQVFEKKTAELYAADAGIEDAVWQVKYDHLGTLFPDYSPYDYTTENCTYTLSEQVNDKNVNVTINNVWIPKDLNPPDKTNAERIIEGITNPVKPPKVILTGDIPSASTYEIKIQSYAAVSENLKINTLGIWLQSGFHAVQSGGRVSSALNGYYQSQEVVNYAGGEAIIWHFSAYPFVGSTSPSRNPFPGVVKTQMPMVSTITFKFTGPPGGNPTAVSWIATDLDLTQGGTPAVTYTWDAGTKIYHINSIAGSTQVEAYTAKSELRTLSTGMAGDYYATGGTLMASTDDMRYREMLFKESAGTVKTDTDPKKGIPADATVEAAYLYWSGWYTGGIPTQIWSDSCSSFGNWTVGSNWSANSTYPGSFQYHDNGGSSTTRYYLTLTNSLNLTGKTGAKVSWQHWERDGNQLEDSDALRFQVSGNGGTSWNPSTPTTAFSNDLSTGDSPVDYSYTIPDSYLTSNFKIRFYPAGFTANDEYCNIDNINISVEGAATVESTKVNRVLLTIDGINNSSVTQITADSWQTKPNTDASSDSWSYSCKKDVTGLVTQLISEGKLGTNGSGKYTVGHWLENGSKSYTLYDVQTHLPTGNTTGYPLSIPAKSETKYQWTYAGWSLVILYRWPTTEVYQLYLFDEFRYVGLDTTLTFPISGFLAPNDTTGSRLTYFVGEGDNHYSGEYIAVNGHSLSDAVNPVDNPFNSYSNSIDDTNQSGIDLDTFDMSSYIKPSDSSATIVLDNGSEIYDLVYIILSFRSEKTTRNAISYLIRG